MMKDMLIIVILNNVLFTKFFIHVLFHKILHTCAFSQNSSYTEDL